VYGRLGVLCYRSGRLEDMRKWFDQAGDLWKSADDGAVGRAIRLRYEAKITGWDAAAATSHVDYCLALQHFKRACNLGQELIDLEPTNALFLGEFSQSYRELLRFARMQHGREKSFEFLTRQRVEELRIVVERSADLLSRKRLALTCLTLGVNRQAEPASAAVFWKEAYELYREIVRTQPEDLMSKRALAECCIQLVERQTRQPYYGQGVALLDEIARKLESFMGDHRHEVWLQHAMIETVCELITCHARAGETAAARSVCEERLEPLSSKLTQEEVGQENALLIASVLLDLAGACRDSGPRDVALRFARNAATIASRIEANNANDLVFAAGRVTLHMALAGILSQLDDNVLALEQAQMAKTIVEKCCRIAPEARPHNRRRAAATWERIGKIQWKLNDRQAALRAFQQAADFERMAFQESSGEPSCRSLLVHRYDRLAYWSGLNRDWLGVTVALHEREKLCPDNAKELLAVAADFEEQAAKLRTGASLSASEKRHLATFTQEAARIRRAAQDAKRSQANRPLPRSNEG
jgi:tetratricopeptide (TPR) repeat protein